MAAFRLRMGTPEAKQIYKRRPAIAEFPNADCRNRGLTQFRVRGLLKAKAQAAAGRLGIQLESHDEFGIPGGGDGKLTNSGRHDQPNQPRIASPGSSETARFTNNRSKQPLNEHSRKKLFRE